MTAKFEAGALSAEMDYQILDDISECAMHYRELYWFRDWPRRSRRGKNSLKGIIIDAIGKRKSAQKDLTECQMRNIMDLAQQCYTAGKIDDAFAGKDLNVEMLWDEIAVSLFDVTEESVGKADPFVKASFLPTPIHISRTGEHTSISALGLCLSTTKPFSFSAYFLSVLYIFHLIENCSIPG